MSKQIALETAQLRIQELADGIFREYFPASPPTWEDGYMRGLYRAIEVLREEGEAT